jgi:hypothetical protein
MLLQLTERYTLEERRLYLARLSPTEEPAVLDPYTSMIRGLLWVSECYNLVGDVEQSPSAWSVDLMTRTWMTYKAKLPGFREDESLSSLMAYCMRFETHRAYAQVAAECDAHDEPLFCRQCRMPKVTGVTGGSSWAVPSREPHGVWSSVPVDSTSSDPPELEVLLPTDGVTRFHVDAHGVRWEIPGMMVSGHLAQRVEPGWGEGWGVRR